MKKIIYFAAVLLVAMAACKKEPPKPEITPETAELTFAYGAGSQSVRLRTNYAWTASVKDAWCSVSAKSGAAGDIDLTADVKENETYDVRTTTITIVAETAIAKIQVTQAAKGAVALDEKHFEIDAEGGNIDVAYQSNVEITAAVEADAKEWLSVVKTRGMENHTMVLGVAKYDRYGVEKRTGRVFVSVEGMDVPDTVFVSQSPKNPLLWSVDLPAASVAAGGPLRIGISGDNLLLADGTKTVQVLNKSDGKQVKTLEAPFAVQSLACDEAGHVAIAANAKQPDHMKVYRAAGLSLAEADLTAICDFNAANLPGWTLGSVRVGGDIAGQGVVSFLGALWNNQLYYVSYELRNGEWSNDRRIFKKVGTAKISGPQYGGILPLGAKHADGLAFIGYSVGYYGLSLNMTPAATPEAFTQVADFGFTANENMAALSAAERGGKKYVAVATGAHFKYSGVLVGLVEIGAGNKEPVSFDLKELFKFEVKEAKPLVDLVLKVEDNRLVVYTVFAGSRKIAKFVVPVE